MKNLILVILVLIVAAILVGCRTAPHEPPTTTPSPTPIPVPTSLPPNAGWACSEQPSPAWGGSGLGDPNSPFWGNGGYDVQHYDIDLSVDVERNHVQGVTVITAEATRELDAFNLDFLGMEISSLLVNDLKVAICRDEEGELTIILSEPLAKGQPFTVQVTYAGTPAVIKTDWGSYGWLQVDDGVLTSGPPNDPAYLYPNNEHFSDLATYTIRVTVPDQYQVSSVGSLEETIQENGLVTTIWRLSVPSWLIGLSINRDMATKQFKGPEGLPIQYRYPLALEEYFEQSIQDFPELVEYFISIFGPFPFDRISVTVVNNQAIFMSMPTLVFTGSADHEVRIPQQLAQQWVAHSVRPGSSTAVSWVFFGIASYSEILWLEHQGQSADDLIRTRYLDLPDATHPPGYYSEDLQLGDGIHDVLYVRPKTAFHALRKRVGDEAFFSILKTFTTRFKGDMVSSGDFILLAEEISGQDLDSFFDAWIYQEPIPDIPELSLSKDDDP